MESNYVKLLKEYNDLAEGYERLQRHLDEETKFHQEQTSQNVAVMTDMQDTITQLRNQLAELRSTRSASSGVYILLIELPCQNYWKLLQMSSNYTCMAYESTKLSCSNQSEDSVQKFGQSSLLVSLRAFHWLDFFPCFLSVTCFLSALPSSCFPALFHLLHVLASFLSSFFLCTVYIFPRFVPATQSLRVIAWPSNTGNIFAQLVAQHCYISIWKALLPVLPPRA